MTPSILIDSADPKFIYTGKQWQSGFDPSTQGGSFNSCHTVPLTSTTVAPTMTLSFQGKLSIPGLGIVEVLIYFRVCYSILRTTWRRFQDELYLWWFASARGGYEFPGRHLWEGTESRDLWTGLKIWLYFWKTGIRLWSIENVTSTSHYISLIPTDGSPIFDYAVVTPTSSTSLSGQILVLDDTDSLIKYNSGGWISDSGTRYSGGISFNDTKRGTNKKGDTFSVAFVGTWRENCFSKS